MAGTLPQTLIKKSQEPTLNKYGKRLDTKARLQLKSTSIHLMMSLKESFLKP